MGNGYWKISIEDVLNMLCCTLTVLVNLLIWQVTIFSEKQYVMLKTDIIALLDAKNVPSTSFRK